METQELKHYVQQISRRAERKKISAQYATFVDSGVSQAVDNQDHQIIFGRRGVGKTHLLGYLYEKNSGNGDIVINIDCRTLNSADSVASFSTAKRNESARKLLQDILTEIHQALSDGVFENPEHYRDDVMSRIENFLRSFSTLQIAGQVEQESFKVKKTSAAKNSKFGIKFNPNPGIGLQADRKSASQEESGSSTKIVGQETTSLVFGDITRALRELARSIGDCRIWLLIDEWSSIHEEIQPLLAEFLSRCMLPVTNITVKIAAIEQRSKFYAMENGVRRIGFELGSDITADISLDDYLAYAESSQQAVDFFKSLLLNHVNDLIDDANSRGQAQNRNNTLSTRHHVFASTNELIQLLFTNQTSFAELVRASEGNPRDFLNIISKSSLKTKSEKISVRDIRSSAKDWYNDDKRKALIEEPEAIELLEHIVETFIRTKSARAFLVNEKDAGNPLLERLFDARVLHIVKRGYSAQDKPGIRFDVWSIDYGAYVDLINTKKSPVHVLPLNIEDGSMAADTDFSKDIPQYDFRSVRRSILDMDEWARST